MNTLMLNQIGSNRCPFSAKQQAKKIDGIVFLKRYQSVVNNKHDSFFFYRIKSLMEVN